MAHQKNNPSANQTMPEQWVVPLANRIAQTNESPETRMRTMISCDVRAGKPSLYVPPDMTELQPRSLRYLHAFARRNDLQLVEDRRRVSIQPVHEQRGRNQSALAKGMGELLRQLGMPGRARTLSSPHRLSADSQHVSIGRLIRMAAFAAPLAKAVKVEANRHLNEVLDHSSDPINAFACKLVSADTSTILSHFDAPHFRAIGYSAGKQYIMHLCVAGGPITAPKLWTHFHTLTRSDFQFQLFNAQSPKNDIGLFYATFYLDLSGTPAPWWLTTWSDTRLNTGIGYEPPILRQAS